MRCKLCYCDVNTLYTCQVCGLLVCAECYEKIPTDSGAVISACSNCVTKAKEELAIETVNNLDAEDASQQLANDLRMEVGNDELIAEELKEHEENLREVCSLLEETYQYDAVRRIHIVCLRLQKAIENMTTANGTAYMFQPFENVPPDNEEEKEVVSSNPDMWEAYMDSIDDASTTIDEIAGKLLFNVKQLKDIGAHRAAEHIDRLDDELNVVKEIILNDKVYLKIAESIS